MREELHLYVEINWHIEKRRQVYYVYEDREIFREKRSNIERQRPLETSTKKNAWYVGDKRDRL